MNKMDTNTNNIKSNIYKICQCKEHISMQLCAFQVHDVLWSVPSLGMLSRTIFKVDQDSSRGSKLFQDTARRS